MAIENEQREVDIMIARATTDDNKNSFKKQQDFAKAKKDQQFNIQMHLQKQ